MILSDLALAASRAIHNGLAGLKVGEKFIPVGKYPRSGVKYLRVHTQEHGTIEFLEQNRNKRSAYGDAARAGQKITWVCKRIGGDLHYTGQGVIDEKFVESVYEEVKP